MSNELFPPLYTKENRPVTWDYGLSGVVGREEKTVTVTIYSKPVLRVNESGEFGYEKYAVVTLTREEIFDILETLNEDVAGFIEHCPGSKFNELKKGQVGWEKYQKI